MEMHRLIEAGLTPVQVFRAATLANAEALGLGGEVGTVQAGKRANLLLLRENPARTIEAYDEILKVILHGRVLDRSELAACRGEAVGESARQPLSHCSTPAFPRFRNEKSGNSVLPAPRRLLHLVQKKGLEIVV
jgi:adenine deaminase